MAVWGRSRADSAVAPRSAGLVPLITFDKFSHSEAYSTNVRVIDNSCEYLAAIGIPDVDQEVLNQHFLRISSHCLRDRPPSCHPISRPAAPPVDADFFDDLLRPTFRPLHNAWSQVAHAIMLRRPVEKEVKILHRQQCQRTQELGSHQFWVRP